MSVLSESNVAMEKGLIGPPSKDLSVVIVTFNSERTIEACLSSIAASCVALSWEVKVVDNNSHDNTISIASGYDNVDIKRCSRNLGFAAACNIGAREATGTNLLFLNPDAYAVGDSLSKMVAFEESVGSGTIVGGSVIDQDGEFTSSIRSFPSVFKLLSEALFLHKMFPKSSLFGTYFYSNISRNLPVNVDAVEGSFMLVPTAVFRKLGGFDESFFLYSEDTDFCFRARKTGVPVVFFPDAKAVHAGQSADDRVSERYVMSMHLAQLKFIRRHFGGAQRFAMVAVKIAGLFVRVPVYFALSVVMLRPKMAKKGWYYLKTALRGILYSSAPPSLFE